MPRGDRTGPVGYGPMTGRGAGFCAGYNAPGNLNTFPGRGYTRFGRGRGFRHMYWATGLPAWARYNPYFQTQGEGNIPSGMTAEQECEMLKNQAKFMQDNLNALNERIQTLEKSGE